MAPERNTCSLTNLLIGLDRSASFVNIMLHHVQNRKVWLSHGPAADENANRRRTFSSLDNGANSSWLISNTMMRFLLLFSFLCDHLLFAQIVPKWSPQLPLIDLSPFPGSFTLLGASRVLRSQKVCI